MKRAYYRFPLSAEAERVVLIMAAEYYQSGKKVHTYRAIARYLVEAHLVDQQPDPATLRRFVLKHTGVDQVAHQVELLRDAVLKRTHGKNGLPELPAVRP